MVFGCLNGLFNDCIVFLEDRSNGFAISFSMVLGVIFDLCYGVVHSFCLVFG